MRFYQKAIIETATSLGLDLDPRHVEAWMRNDHGTLNHLPADVFVTYCRRTANADEDMLDELEMIANTLRIA